MTKGATTLTFRPGEALLQEMDEAIFLYNAKQHCREPIDRSEFLRRAIRQKLDHGLRSRRSSKKSVAHAVDTGAVAFTTEASDQAVRDVFTALAAKEQQP